MQIRPRRWSVVAGLVAVAVLVAFAVATPAQAQQGALPASVETAVRSAAATELSVAGSSVTIERVESVTWRDSCLGAGGPAEVCLLVLTPGYAIWVSADTSNSGVLRYHTDESGSNVRLAESGINADDVALAPLPAGTIGPESSQFAGQEIPSEGGVVLLSTTEEATTSLLVQDLEVVGCDPITIARTVSGTWQIYIPGAPDAVNEASGFPDPLAADSVIFVRCDEGGTPTDPGGGTSDFSTDPVDETNREGNALLVDVRVGEHAGYDRIVFEFSSAVPSELTAAAGVPAYSVEYNDGIPTECGSGMPASIQGSAMLEITLPGTYVIDPESGTPLVDSLERTENHQVVRELEEICAFEGNSTWVAGLSTEAPFRITELSSPMRLVVDVQTSSVASPELSQTCANEEGSYSVDYPAGWETNDGTVTAVCSYFAPSPFTVPANQEFLDAAVSLDVEQIDFDVASEPSEMDTLISSGSTVIAGRNAVWMLTESSGSALVPDGTTTYMYVIDLGDGQSFIAVTRDLAGQDFEENRDILDRMVETLSFS